jgi:Prolipoprotein diacylglyceryl transferase
VATSGTALTAKEALVLSENAKVGRLVENVLRPSARVAGRDVSMFHVAGIGGFLAATAVALGLGAHLGLSVGWLVVLAAGAALSFFAVAVVTWASLGVERLVFYRHEIVVLAMVAVASSASGRPTLAYLDVATIALGVFLAFGRIGCAMVGCCHGLPFRFGLRYRDDHAAAGFAWWLVGVPLAPVQVIESALVALLTALGATWLWRGAPPGAVFARQLVSYALLRFALEHARGDIERPAWLGLSEAQWTAALVALGVAVAEWANVLPPSRWHTGAAALLLAAASWTVRGRRRARLFAPAHVAELARAIRDPHVGETAHVHVRATSLGVCLSVSALPAAPQGPAHLYTLSGVDGRDARALASLLVLLRGAAPAAGPGEIIQGSGGLLHLLVRSAGAAR